MPAKFEEDDVVDYKIVSISNKRQMTIPLKYYQALGFKKEAECVVRDGGILIRPIRAEDHEFSELILSDLIAEGYEGQELLQEFRQRSQKIRPAVEQLIAEADSAARAGKKTTLDKIFGPEN